MVQQSGAGGCVIVIVDVVVVSVDIDSGVLVVLMAASSMQVVAIAVNWVVASVDVDSGVLVVLMAASSTQIGRRCRSPIDAKSRVVVWWSNGCVIDADQPSLS